MKNMFMILALSLVSTATFACAVSVETPEDINYEKIVGNYDGSISIVGPKAMLDGDEEYFVPEKKM